MSMRFWAASLAVVVVVVVAGPALVAGQEKAGSAEPKSSGKAGTKDKAAEPATATGPAEESATSEKKSAPKLEQATFGGGCFWCMEAVFERIPGVKNVVSGYAGGNVPNPTYEMVHSGLTGHAEVIQITYDPAVTTYDKLLKVFWKSHDPTTPNQQGVDVGTQYRSVIFYHDEAQKQAAQKSYNELTAAGVYRAPIVTELVPLIVFYPAEAYHQDYYRKHPRAAYCQLHIVPKLRKLKLK